MEQIREQFYLSLNSLILAKMCLMNVFWKQNSITMYKQH